MNVMKHKDDQMGKRNPYKCMNVMKQYAMDDKIIERCKTCEKQCMQESLDRSRSCRAVIEQKPTSMDRESISQTESFSMDRRSCRAFIEKNSRDLNGSKLR